MDHVNKETELWAEVFHRKYRKEWYFYKGAIIFKDYRLQK